MQPCCKVSFLYKNLHQNLTRETKIFRFLECVSPLLCSCFSLLLSLSCGARGRCRISPPRFLAECRKRRLNQGSFVSAVCLVVCFLWFVLYLCAYFCDLYWVFPYCVFVSNSQVISCEDCLQNDPYCVQRPTHTVSGGALNSTQSNPLLLSIMFLAGVWGSWRSHSATSEASTWQHFQCIATADWQ